MQNFSEQVADLNEQIKELQLLVHHSLDVIYKVDTDGMLKYVSPSVEKLTGRTVPDWIENANAYVRSIPENLAAIENAIQLARAGKPVPPYRIRYNHPNGKLIWVEIKEQAYKEDGIFAGFIGIARDITDRVKMEEELHRQHILLERELEVATRVHETLIPKNLKTDQLDLALTYRPVSSMGGDYASYFLHDNRLLFIISDVTGHGVPAALLVNRVDSEFKRQASKNKEPGDIMKTLESFIEHQFRGTQMYLSAFCGALEFGSGRLAYSNYGHLPQIVFNPEENKIDLMEAQTTLLGIPVNRGEAPIQDEITLSPQARIFLFTDGVTETKGPEGELFGYDRLQGLIQEHAGLPPERFNKHLLDELTTFKHDDFEDDIFMFHLERTT
ncbi:MAG: SpoIIE family protein phosphatase [Candidatus Nitronauta litoralis]|uniref:SpoIIE family protein phosphatase n=1 Tax=Candidatus Nitronauta litoralis TaxID=2705533 RepID=A0A7T0BY49_9BACT|nr:MAG: SpoIIE family protein phosphatase [Candidatus Nitronauta litoralis]